MSLSLPTYLTMSPSDAAAALDLRRVGPSMTDVMERFADPGLRSDREQIDRALADWWVADGAERRTIWAAAAAGEVAAVDWLTWAIVRTTASGCTRLRALLALDLRDASRVVMYVNGGTDTALLSVATRSPVRVVQWLMASRIQMASVVDRTDRLAGSAVVTGAWLDGRVAERGDEFDALAQVALVGGGALVVELDHGVRRHVMVPVAAMDDSLDADHYCVDLLRRRGGWFGRHGRWTWDDRPVDPIPARPSPRNLSIPPR